MMRTPSRMVWLALRKRIVLGLLMVLIAILCGWSLPPHLVVDKATQEWYTQP